MLVRKMQRLALGTCRALTTAAESTNLAPSKDANVLSSSTVEGSSTDVKSAKRELWRKPNSPFIKTPQAWISSLETVEEQRTEIIDLHPDVFRVAPRLDILHRNITWQTVYRNVQMTKMLTKAEMPGGGRKPWPQKKTGRAHVGSIRSPQFIRGGFAHGARGPRTWFYMLPDSIRVQGLCVALTVKHAQDDLHIVDTLDGLTNGEPQYWMDLCESRNWGYSVLMINDKDEITGGLAEASQALPWLTVMPVYGLNCYSLLKYDTVVFSRSALDQLESRLLHHIHKAAVLNKKYRYADYKETILNEAKVEEDPHMPPMF